MNGRAFSRNIAGVMIASLMLFVGTGPAWSDAGGVPHSGSNGQGRQGGGGGNAGGSAERFIALLEQNVQKVKAVTVDMLLTVTHTTLSGSEVQTENLRTTLDLKTGQVTTQDLSGTTTGVVSPRPKPVLPLAAKSVFPPFVLQPRGYFSIASVDAAAGPGANEETLTATIPARGSLPKTVVVIDTASKVVKSVADYGSDGSLLVDQQATGFVPIAGVNLPTGYSGVIQGPGSGVTVSYTITFSNYEVQTNAKH